MICCFELFEQFVFRIFALLQLELQKLDLFFSFLELGLELLDLSSEFVLLRLLALFVHSLEWEKVLIVCLALLFDLLHLLLEL